MPHPNPNPDRRTGIQADQMQDHTITPFELDTENFPEDFEGEIVLTINPLTGKLKYVEKELIGAVDKYFQLDEDNNITLFTLPIFILDGQGNLMISENGTQDPFFEIDADNNVTPKQ